MEYGSVRFLLESFLDEGAARSRAHANLSAALINEDCGPLAVLRSWNEYAHCGPHESRQLTQSFEAAQTTWSRYTSRVESARQELLEAHSRHERDRAARLKSFADALAEYVPKRTAYISEMVRVRLVCRLHSSRTSSHVPPHSMCRGV